jgi:hypothetical protein
MIDPAPDPVTGHSVGDDEIEAALDVRADLEPPDRESLWH